MLNTANHSTTYAARLAIKAPAWHGLVAWDVFLNGLTTGLFLVAALAEVAWPERFSSLARIACPFALVLLFGDLLLLVLDLGDSWRFHHMLRMFKPGSPMSVGVWSLTIYSLPLTLLVLLGLFPDGALVNVLRKIAIVLGIVPALASAVYKGVLLSTSAQPGWQDSRWLGAYLTSGAIMLGCAEMIVLAFVVSQSSAAEALRMPLAIVLLIHIAPTILTFAELWPTASPRFSPQRRILVATTIGGALLVPLALVVLTSGILPLLTAAIVILVGNLGTRFMLVQVPHLTVLHPDSEDAHQ